MQKLDSLTDEKVNAELNNIQIAYNRIQKAAYGIYLLVELQKQNKNMKIRFKKPIDDINKLKIDIKEYEKYINLAQKAVDEAENNKDCIFSEKNRAEFNKESLIAEYRLDMLILLKQMFNDSSSYNEKTINENPFDGLDPAKQEIFSDYLLDDLSELSKDFERITNSSEIIDKYYRSRSMSVLDSIATELGDLIDDRMIVDNLSLKNVFNSDSKDFDSVDFLRKMVLLRYHTNQITDQLTKFRTREKEQQELGAQEANEYVYITDNEIDEQIQRILDDFSLSGNKQLAIYDFQKEVATKKGLLTDENQFNIQGLSYISIPASELLLLIKRANDEGIRYKVFPDAQEFNKDLHYLVIVPEKDKQKVIKSDNKKPFYNKYRVESYSLTLGKYTLPIIQKIYEVLKNKYYIDNIGCFEHSSRPSQLYVLMYYYNNSNIEKDIESEIVQIYNEIKGKTIGSDKSYKNVMCYLKVSVQTNIIPILETLKENKIKFFLEPEPKDNSTRNTVQRDFIHIYINREDADRYRDVLSTFLSKNGATLCGENINIGNEIIKECEWSGIEEER